MSFVVSEGNYSMSRWTFVVKYLFFFCVSHGIRARWPRWKAADERVWVEWKFRYREWARERQYPQARKDLIRGCAIVVWVSRLYSRVNRVTRPVDVFIARVYVPQDWLVGTLGRTGNSISIIRDYSVPDVLQRRPHSNPRVTEEGQETERTDDGCCLGDEADWRSRI